MKSKPQIIIADRLIQPGSMPFIIAEAGVNHENEMSQAERMILEAAKAGANAIKFQAYKAEAIAAADSPTYWDQGGTQREYFKRFDHFGEKEHRHLSSLCSKHGIVYLCSPFDLEAVDYLEPLMPAYKIASAEITNLILLRRIAQKKKPVLLSTGASNLSEIARAVEVLREFGAPQIALFHCVLHYPADYSEANLRSISYLQKVFPDCVIGYSDHTKPDPGMALVTTAAVLGACMIEKHFTWNKNLPGNDHYHAMDAQDLTLFVNNLKTIWQALGAEGKAVGSEELSARRYARKSVVAQTLIRKGETLQPFHLTTKRPATGIPADQYDFVIGRTAEADIEPDTILKWNMFEQENVSTFKGNKHDES